mgnify:CR=1 FL=1
MPITTQQVIDLIDKGTSDNIRLARKRAKVNNLHITGKGVKDALEKLDDYENDAQKALREKLVKSLRATFSFILRPMDKIFTAKGGAINYNLPQEQVNSIKLRINDVADGLDIRKYLKKVVKNHYVIDPNGVLFIDIDAKGDLETHVISTNEILWYENKGNMVKAIIFEPKEIKVPIKNGEKKIKEYRVIDEDYDMIFINDGSGVREDLSRRLDNFFGYVPAMILGDEKDYNDDIFESIIADIIEDANTLLRRVSTTTVHELAHLYPRYWSYGQACTRCDGEGEIQINVGTDETPDFEKSTCASCGGDGLKKRTNASDEIVLPIPQDGDTVIAPGVAGYVQPDLESAKFYVEYIEKDKNNMFQSMWGTTYEGGGKRETATGRFLDAQPVQDRLRDISHTFAMYHKFMLDAYVKVLTNNIRYESSVTYGMRYILESPDDILDKYLETSKENVSELVQIDMQGRYFDAEYQNDSVELSKRKKLGRVEPFPTMSASEVSKDDSIPTEDKLKKYYFVEWVGSLTDAEIIFTDQSGLKESLTNYVKTKNINQNQ